MKDNLFNFCQNCSGHRCCGLLNKEDTVYLTEYDTKLLKTIPNFKHPDFINKKIHPNTGKILYLLKINRVDFLTGRVVDVISINTAL